MNNYAAELLDVCGQAVLVVDPETLIIEYANAETGSLYECPADALLGRTMLEIDTGLQEQFFWEEIRCGISSGVPRLEGTIQTQRGLVRHVVKTVERRVLGDRSRIVVTTRDISTERAIEELAARSASLLAATLESTADGLLVLDLAGRIQNFNRRFAHIFGLPPELATSRDTDVLFARVRAGFVTPSAWDDALASGLKHPGTTHLQTLALADGRWLDCALRPQSLRGQVIGQIWSFSEVTDRMRHEEALLTARDAADSANRAKSQFLSAMSHELRTPLNAILGFTQLLEFDGMPQQVESLQTIRQAGEHLLALIDEVLDLARIEAGRIDLHIQQVQLSDVVQEAIALTRPLASQYDITIQPDIGSHVVMADPLRLRQVLINLISNGSKYNHRNGSVAIRSRACSLATGTGVAIEVADTGIGIAEEDFDKLFQPFSRIGGTPSQVEGTGLGLALVWRLIELMRGKVRVESVVGDGSRFIVELPSG